MSLGKVLIYVEGFTEQSFVRRVLAPYLSARGVLAVPKIVTTRVVRSGPDFKGGVTSYTKARRELLSLLGDTSAALVTTMIDYYGLPSDFPGKSTLPAGTCYERVVYLEQAFSNDIGHTRFRPHLQLHEFEAIVFADPTQVALTLAGGKKEAELTRIRAAFVSPEEIDDGETTAPSKRLQALFPGYQKSFHGPVITARIGIDRIRSECRHFDQWLTFLESVSPA